MTPLGVQPTVVSSPTEGIYRLARADPGPFEPRAWGFARPDGTFGNRFDDPAVHLPPEQRFQVLYCATQRHATFGETLSSLRLSLPTAIGLQQVKDDESLESVLSRSVDPEAFRRGLIREEWRLQNVIGHTILNTDLQFVNLSSAETAQYLRHELAEEAVAHGATDIDQSLLMESRRGFTRQVARFFYEQRNADGSPSFAGIRYMSRHDLTWECWAIFVDRMKHVRGMPGIPQRIHPDDPDLMRIAALFELTIETVDGSGHYYRP